MRRRLFWKLLGIADHASDIAFSRPGRGWQSFWVGVANGVDRLAGWVMTEEMKREPAKAAFPMLCAGDDQERT